jgi:putative membrane protein
MFMAGHSVVYELIEFAGGRRIRRRSRQAYLGTQGDVWDSQKDMALALAGTTVTLMLLAGSGAPSGAEKGDAPLYPRAQLIGTH